LAGSEGKYSNGTADTDSRDKMACVLCSSGKEEEKEETTVPKATT